MNPTRKRRMIWVLLLVAAAAVAIGLSVYALQQNISYLYSPTEVLAGKAPAHARFRLGGVVKDGSIHHDSDSLKVSFVLTDRFHDMPVIYKGVLPDLFRVDQSVITSGRMQAGRFVASSVLDKHEATYMHKEVADAIKKAQAAGRAKHGGHTAAATGSRH